jgi:DNA-binding MarR family transcriptional regulator
LRLLKASTAIEQDIRRRLRSECNTTLPRFDVMAALARAPDGLKMSEISLQLRVSNGNITGIIDKLVAEGLVRRLSVPGDRRAACATLTDQGRAEFADQATKHEKWVNEMLCDIDIDDLSELTRHLTLLNQTLDQGPTHD